MIYLIGICIGVSALFEALSYCKQIKKIRVTHRSKDVSSTSYLDKEIKYLFGVAALTLSKNYVGLALELFAFLLCTITTYYVIKNKPKDWRWK